MRYRFTHSAIWQGFESVGRRRASDLTQVGVRHQVRRYPPVALSRSLNALMGCYARRERLGPGKNLLVSR